MRIPRFRAPPGHGGATTCPGRLTAQRAGSGLASVASTGKDGWQFLWEITKPPNAPGASPHRLAWVRDR